VPRWAVNRRTAALGLSRPKDRPWSAQGCGFHNGRVDILDVLCYKPKLSATYDPRYDLDANEVINILDVLLFKPVIGTQCTNP